MTRFSRSQIGGLKLFRHHGASFFGHEKRHEINVLRHEIGVIRHEIGVIRHKIGVLRHVNIS